MVITVGLGQTIVRWVLVDSGASVNILFFSAFHRMKLSMSDVKACQNKVHRFTGQAIQPIGVISLLVELGEGEQKAARVQDFVTIDEPSAYNAFLGRPTLAAFRITMAPWRLTMKFPTENGVGTIIGDQ